MSECAGSIDSIKRVKLILNEDEQLEDQGLTGFSAADNTGTADCIKHTHLHTFTEIYGLIFFKDGLCSGVIERWELLQVQSPRVPQDLQQWHRLNSDLSDIMAWLNAVMPELETLQTLEAKITIRDMESKIHKLKVFLDIKVH